MCVYAPLFYHLYVVYCTILSFIVYLSDAADVVYLILEMFHSWITYFSHILTSHILFSTKFFTWP